MKFLPATPHLIPRLRMGAAIQKLIRFWGFFPALSLGGALALAFWGLGSPAAATEYFAGPFASWINVQSAPYNATGNGTTDDTAALQSAINAMSVSQSVVYLPAGTYKISAPLTVQNQYGFTFAGASPASVTILWAGATGGTMMEVLATGTSNWGRITWEGSGTAAIGVAHTCLDADCSTGTPPSNNRHFDEVFQDMGKGIAGGVNQVVLNSEMTITRCVFRNCSFAGLSVESYNALDYWVWDSQFYNCARGLTNDVSGGNFMAFRCLFEGSTIADFKFTNAEFFSARGNVSIGSNQFINGLGSNSAVELTVENNRVVNTTNPLAIYLNNLGPILLVDNQIESSSGATSPAVELITPNGNDVGGPDLVSIGDQYTISNPITVIGQILAPGQAPRWWTQEDQVVAYGSISSAPPAPPPLPTSLTTNITDMPVSSSAASLQAAINAVTLISPVPTYPPVIHLPAGSYPLSQGITIPANLSLFIVGDNEKTQLINNSPGPLFQLNGPSKVTIRDMSLNGGPGAILVLGADQPGSRVFGEGLFMSTNKTGDVLADGLANTYVELQGLVPLRGSMVSVKSIGAGVTAASCVGLYGAAAGTAGGVAPANGWMYEVSNGGRMLVEDAWYESGSSPVVNLTYPDSGVFCDWSANIGQGSVGMPVILEGFNGLASFLNVNYGIQAGGQITGGPAGGESGQTQAWFLNQVANQSDYFNITGTGGGAGDVFGTAYLENSKTGNQQIPNQGLTGAPPQAFTDSMLNLARNEAAQPVIDLPAGVTDARLYRLIFNNCGQALHIVPGNSLPPTVTPTAVASPPPAPGKPYAYPQPAQNQLTLVYPSGSAQQVRLNIYAFSGQEVATLTAQALAGNNNEAPLLVQSFAPGVYFYVIHGLGSGRVEAKGKFMVIH